MMEQRGGKFMRNAWKIENLRGSKEWSGMAGK